MKKLLEILPLPRKYHRLLLAGILSANQFYGTSCSLARSVILSPGIDSGVTDSSYNVEGGETDGNLDDAFDSGEFPDSGNDSSTTDAPSREDTGRDASQDSSFPARERCGRGLIPSFPLSYDIPTGMTVPAEVGIADRMPDARVIAGIIWGDALSIEMVNFNAALRSQALTNHVYLTSGTYAATWFVNETECGMQTFTVVDGARTRPSCTSSTFESSVDTIPVGGSTTLIIGGVPRSPASGDSPLRYYIENAPTSSGMISFVGPTNRALITATNPPGPGSYSLLNWVITPRGERADCPSPTLTVRP